MSCPKCDLETDRWSHADDCPHHCVECPHYPFLRHYTTYDEARKVAQRLANWSNVSLSLEKFTKNNGDIVYVIGFIPSKQYRSGRELRCEVVDSEHLD